MALILSPLSTKTPNHHYDAIDEALTNLLRASKAKVSDEMLAHPYVFERTLRGALGLPVEMDG